MKAASYVKSEAKKSCAGQKSTDSESESDSILFLSGCVEFLLSYFFFSDLWLRVLVAWLTESPSKTVVWKAYEVFSVVVFVESGSQTHIVATVKDRLSIFLMLRTIDFIVNVNHCKAVLNRVSIRVC